MKTNHQLIQTICTLAPYGLQVIYRNGEVFTVNPRDYDINNKKQTISIDYAIEWVEQGKAKLLLHSTSKLTESIIDGFEPRDILEAMDLEKFSPAFPFNNWNKINLEVIENCPAWFFNQLAQWHFNLFNLPSEYFTEKSTLKN